MTTRRGFLGALLAAAAAPALVGFQPRPVALAIAPDRYINVLDFGADPTGREESTQAFRRALNACRGGGAVWVPAGTYSLAGVTMRSGQQLSGMA